jgi:hypothetical protein
MEASELSRFLESFMVTRWGRQVMGWPRADRTTRPWGNGPASTSLHDFTWAVFRDGGQPLAVGIRAGELRRGAQLFVLVYWWRTHKIESHHWRCDSAAGWQHVAELSPPE